MRNQLKVSDIRHLLMIVPHQDDEILMGAGLIYELLQQKKRVTVAIVTNGDHQCEDFSKGRIRLLETLEGLQTLGLSRENVIFLGYADTGMSREESFLMKLHQSYEEQDGKRIHPSAASCETYGRKEQPDFHYQCHHCHGTYCADTLREDLWELLRRQKPDCILTTHSSDRHGDHEGLFYFIRDLLAELPKKPRLLVSLIHSPQGDDTWPERQTLSFSCPAGLEEEGLQWRERLVLPLRKELTGGQRVGNLKFEALKKYETALEPGAYDYLMSFIKDEEIFWQIG